MFNVVFVLAKAKGRTSGAEPGLLFPLRMNQKLTLEKLEFIKANYSSMSNAEIADAVGISRSRLSVVASKLRLRKSEAFLHKYHVLNGKASGGHFGDERWLTPEMVQKRAVTFVHTYNVEKARVAFGLPQKTKIKVRREPKQKQCQRNYLKRLGYIIDDRNNIAYYTDTTKRAVRMERNGWKSFYKFQPKTGESCL